MTSISRQISSAIRNDNAPVHLPWGLVLVLNKESITVSLMTVYSSKENCMLVRYKGEQVVGTDHWLSLWVLCNPAERVRPSRRWTIYHITIKASSIARQYKYSLLQTHCYSIIVYLWDRPLYYIGNTKQGSPQTFLKL